MTHDVLLRLERHIYHITYSTTNLKSQRIHINYSYLEYDNFQAVLQQLTFQCVHNNPAQVI